MADTMHTCVICHKLCKRNHKRLQCNICNKWYHKNCCKLTSKQYDQYIALNDIYYCKLCIDSLFPFQQLNDFNEINSSPQKIHIQHSTEFDITPKNADGSEVLSNNFEYSNYYDVREMKKIFTKSSQNDLSILHFNARSLKKNKEKIEELLNEIGYLPDIIAISESKIKTNTVDNISFAQYSFLHKDSNTIGWSEKKFEKSVVLKSFQIG